MTFELFQGGKVENNRFVCSWCGQGFPVRYDLDEVDGKRSLQRHWEETPTCAIHRNVNNPLQQKYGDSDLKLTMPGQETLDKVRLHETPSE